jgi:thiamine biosynthesis lipoprotein
MGTTVTIDVRDAQPAADAVDAAIRWLHHVDATFSTYRESSAVRRIDRGDLDPADAGADVRWVLERCDELREETSGFFDARAAGTFDPSALVKGWAVQRAAKSLTRAGVDDFCLTAGGDVVVRGQAGPGRPWRVGIQHPLDRESLAAVVEVGDAAVATSGAYERGAHILDPFSGRPPEGVLSVTVVGPDLGTADAYATAAFAMGTDGPDWTRTLGGYEAMTVLADETVLSTPGFPAVPA